MKIYGDDLQVAVRASGSFDKIIAALRQHAVALPKCDDLVGRAQVETAPRQEHEAGFVRRERLDFPLEIAENRFGENGFALVLDGFIVVDHFSRDKIRRRSERRLRFLAQKSILKMTIKHLSPTETVQKQLDSYNNRDIEGFLDTFSDDIQIFNLFEGKLVVDGLDACRSLYQNLFDNSPNLHSELLNRMAFDNVVIDHERITGRLGNPEAIELAMVYEVAVGKIYKCTLLRR